MASRRDELNAYTFAKRRTVAAFLQPSATGTEEGAPRPLRAVVPGVVIGALVVAGFGAWGMFRPQAPKGWDEPGATVIVGRQSTTRYVVLTTKVGGKDQTRLHPVLNLASARLLLDPQKFKVVQVEDKVLDAGKPPRGPIIGIPYAPDRLPAKQDAGKAKRWAVCQQPGGNGRGVQTAAFVLADREAGLLDDARRTADGQVLYVQSTGGAKERFLVDAAGTRYRFPEGRPDSATLTTALVGTGATPQPVTAEWLATLNAGDDLAFPQLPGTPGANAAVPGLGAADARVGMVLTAQTGSGTQHYVVLPDRVAPVSEFVAWLLISSPATDSLNMHGKAHEIDLQSLGPDATPFKEEARWPRKRGPQVNRVADTPGAPQGAERRDTVCNVLRSVDGQGNQTLSTWAGTGFPVDIAASGTSSYVTPGTGLLYTQVQGRQTTAGGSLFLVTDTGLRYAVQANGDSDAAQSKIGAPDPQAPGGGGDGRPEASQAQIRLGYGGVVPAMVPIAWSEFLSKGPRLDTNSARQPQGS
ncbi:ESX-1 secretion system protein eccB1 [Streptomyces lavendulae subsp. lavendulae]|uniref:ESX-1 secretion system protein eccB1 n=1 Tax=Streptomyces lavendulae subsp. lavendulae TaxID=58340 RepID=A0A2K8PBL7_STRLA|nr:type VII secretion protein EccB [Streptomyces lavendulae]ATZ24126.1 ESX-1 secretion system protein eccB1 [Streptomyces lavendulae subsp. lavendulae]QUQ53957.1 ESX-3 secretion system ATPase EccB3 [Streptomyces lavendulae subsp. lavendulae]